MKQEERTSRKTLATEAQNVLYALLLLVRERGGKVGSTYLTDRALADLNAADGACKRDSARKALSKAVVSALKLGLALGKLDPIVAKKPIAESARRAAAGSHKRDRELRQRGLSTLAGVQDSRHEQECGRTSHCFGGKPQPSHRPWLAERGETEDLKIRYGRCAQNAYRACFLAFIVHSTRSHRDTWSERMELTTEALAYRLGLKPQSIHAQLSRTGSYFGIRPIKLPNRRLLWPHNTLERLINGKSGVAS